MPSRRSFIKSSSLMAVAASFSQFAFSIPSQQKKIGVALVGLGYYSRDVLAPALLQTQFCELRGIVTGSPEKIPVWQQKYGIKDANVYNYETMHQIANNDDIDVVYIVLPNGLHKQYTLIAANAGKHVWCEKPMALNAEECQEMIHTCSRNKVQLTIGYRMQHEPVTKEIISWRQSKPYGELLRLQAAAGYYNSGGDGTHWKLHKELGGGAMYDMGVYPLNAVRYATGLEPLWVEATTENKRPSLFKVDETTRFELGFTRGIRASCMTTFAGRPNKLRVECERGWYELDPFQSYSGVKGTTSDGATLSAFRGNQQAQQMDDDALAILQNKNPIVPGEEGLKDLIVVDAIFASAVAGGERIKIGG